MSQTEHRCVCGATVRYKQDLIEKRGVGTPTWKCKDCLSPVPAIIAEKIRHQHPT